MVRGDDDLRHSVAVAVENASFQCVQTPQSPVRFIISLPQSFATTMMIAIPALTASTSMTSPLILVPP